MDCSHSTTMDDGDLSWSDSHSMDSDDLQSIQHHQSHWMVSLSSLSASSSASFTHTGQLSPISNGMDASSASTSSASDSPPDQTLPHPAWTMTFAANDHGDKDAPHDIAWEQGSDDILLAPKLEPLDDDDICMDDLKEAPLTPIPAASNDPAPAPPRVKRPRGRPRKHPVTPTIAAMNKITKGRSKTGCLTCRKRKKKCDEAKPRCMNCEKNAVVCEGYPEKQIWKSGKERAEEERLKSHTLPLITLQPIFHGLETLEDRIFWKHYNEHLSTVLTVEGEHRNAFKDMMIPIAVKHQGLMHSILSLASKHIDFDTPYGINILRNNPNTTLQALRERSIHHHDEARQKFYADVRFCNEEAATEDNVLISARYGQMLCFLLEAQAEGSSRGDHRLHLSAYRKLITTSPPNDPAFFSFISEFFEYHIYADELIHSALESDCQTVSEGTHARPHIHPPRLLGVADGLLDWLSQTTAIRNVIRRNMLAHVDPVVDYVSLYNAVEIDVTVREWLPHWPPGDSRERVGHLYKQMVYIHLLRTVYPPSPTATTSSSAASLPILHGSPPHPRSASSVINNTPPRSASTSCASSPQLCGFPLVPFPSPRSTKQNVKGSILSRKNSVADASCNQDAESRPDSPPPIRRPPLQEHDPRVTHAVDSSLELLHTFKPSDPSQTLLLLPCFIVGTACFTPENQDKIRTAIKTFKGYTGMRNADRVLEVLEEIWQLMSAGKWLAVWDWPNIARRMNLDFIPA